MVLHRKWLDKYLNGDEIDYLLPLVSQWKKVYRDEIDLNIFNYGDVKFRDSIKYININGFEVPEPLRLRPDVGEEYYRIDILSTDLFGGCIWVGYKSEVKWLMRGLCHSTKEAAILHSQALLSFTSDLLGGKHD